MTEPSLATVKRLFAVSGNLCAFPKCKNSLTDSQSGKVTGKICHIKARSPDGPRYDAGQTEKERHAFDNLLILCPIHHDVVDSDVESYTVERLAKMKAEHEQKFQQGREPTDEIAAQFIANITANTITHGSIVFTQNQLGGQAAHTIINVGPPPRRISDAAGVALVSELQKYPKGPVYVASVMGDAEAAALTEEQKSSRWRDGGSVRARLVSLAR
jgi:hypothetical protein